MNLDAFSYDEAIERLQQIHKDLTEDNISIDELEKTITEANDLINKCKKKLIQIEGKINLELTTEQ